MTNKTKIEIALLLPEIADTRDSCIRRLTDLVKARVGINAAHLVESQSGGIGELCIHYDPDQLSIGEVRELAQRGGAELDKRFGHLLLKTEPMHARQARTIESRAKQFEGVLEVSASPAGVLRFEFDRQLTDEETIREDFKGFGFEQKTETRITKTAGSAKACATGDGEKGDHSHQHGGIFGQNSELIFAVICGLMLLAGWVIAWTNITPWIPWGFYLGAYFFGGFYTFGEAIENIRAKRFEIDFLMLVSAVGAAVLGEWFEGALLLFLFSVGHALENYAMGRAKRAIEALAELAPATALVRRDGSSIEVPVDQLRRGDAVIVKPNERLPADGFVLVGEGSVNQAPITGESMPVEKRPVADVQSATLNPDQLEPQYRVFAGTINGNTALEIQVTKLAQESTLARVVKLVSEAETQKSPTQLFTDKFERYFVPAVLVLIVLLLFAGFVFDEPFSATFYRAMAVSVAASPCALAIATPSAVLSGVARAARGGVLIKGGGPLEQLGQIRAIAFDKTGTLTEGMPRLTDVVGFEGITEEELLGVAVAVEKLSDHPLASAVVSGGIERIKNGSKLLAQDVASITGLGVKAIIDSEQVYIGKEKLFSDIGGPLLDASMLDEISKLKMAGRTTMIVRRGERYLGVLGVMDTPREAAKTMISALKELGVERMIMLSGDNQQVADAVARSVGIDEAHGDMMPEDKVSMIKKLSAEYGVAMVGDGVNDAPALASATVGIAMGAAGSDVALETADVALMADDLSHLPFAVGLSRQTSRIIRQNLWCGLGMVAILIPATLLGLRMGAAVVFHEGSTLLVVFNALRLLAYRNK